MESGWGITGEGNVIIISKIKRQNQQNFLKEQINIFKYNLILFQRVNVF